MEGMTHRWGMSRFVGRGEAVGLRLGVDPLVERWLWSRGYRDEGEARSFLRPSLSALHDPALLPGCERACARILEAMSRRERIVIYGDYDVDGMTASAILYRVIRAIDPEADVSTYVPHRLDEGYGLHGEALRALAGEGARVVVSVDCGITAVEAAREAKEAGLDLIITDHHNPPAHDDPLPDAYCVVHPRVGGAGYPFGELCGAGVAFKMAWCLATTSAGTERVDASMRLVLLDCVALAGLGTIADIVPLRDENRVIAKHGLARLRSTEIEGLGALIRASGLEGEEIDSEHVGFVLGPRLNACGRMGHAREAVELLTTARGERAAEIARELTRLNEDRRAEEARITGEAIELTLRNGMGGDATRAIVLACEGWHPGVIGIVCSRLVERYHKPTILLNRDGDQLQGSGRSIDGFNLHGALVACAGHLTKFGGHDMAAGLAMDGSAFEGFVRDFLAHAEEHIDSSMLLPGLDVDCEAGLGELTMDAAHCFDSLGPFGRESGRPRLLMRRVVVDDEPRPMGSKGAHAQITVVDGGMRMRLVGWNWGERVSRIRRGDRVDVVVTPKINRWRGRVSVEGELRDLRASLT
ncbi:MAG: single-stranded-DNA-specific exonuclease RecJ [Phycisphaeraceae bacterium]|nr:single-stranded-DNA-specific exonuclease RecJ [Phycisphaerales bacterium]MCB9843404.1 single-stranded-DNA-specific exonuclease RecJ [Phycisphaeraceae bacterium]